MVTYEHLALFKSLFKGRQDVFAVRWEKGLKHGYMPAYQFDPNQFRIHKIKGGSFQNFPGKTYKALSDNELTKHLTGQQFIGIYPLLQDNTSWFIAADFDKEKWQDESSKFIRHCRQNGIPAYIERSRSGNGAHVWVFFDQPYSSFKSRRIAKHLLEESGVVSAYDKSYSFDRLFPNQDKLSGKRLGNLIALPFHGLSMAKGNCCFLDVDTLNPKEDQWGFLSSIQRVSVEELDRLHYSVSTEYLPDKPILDKKAKLVIRLNSVVQLNQFVPLNIASYLKDELNFLNSEFVIKKQIGKNTWGTERYFNMIEETENGINIPRGFIGKLIRYCRQEKIEFELEDLREKQTPVSYTTAFTLKEHQTSAYDAAVKKDFGIIVAPPGAGKTVIALALLAAKQQPALIVVHRRQLAEQWVERIETFLGIPKNQIGNIGQGKMRIGKQVTVAMMQSLETATKGADPDNLKSRFGTIVIDECHHVPAETFRNTISKLNTYFLYGLTATPFRKYNDGKLIFSHLGDIIAEVKPKEIKGQLSPKIIIRSTELSVPFNGKIDKFEILSKILVHDTGRNRLIISDIIHELNNGKKVVVLTERKEHIDTINQFLKQSYETVTLSGEDSGAAKKGKWKILSEGSFQVLITTGQYFGEGSDLQKISTLFLVYPFSFEGKLIQYIGRVQRAEISPVIYDYRDFRIAYLEQLFQKRNAWYKKIEREQNLFDQEDIFDGDKPSGLSRIKKTVKVPFESLIFSFGMISVDLELAESNKKVSIEIANDNIRPEFEVLKPYFVKLFRSGIARIDLVILYENNKLTSIHATSSDLDRINDEVIESVKFRFVSRGLTKKLPPIDVNLLDLAQLQSQDQSKNLLFTSEEDLLNTLLKEGNVRHYLQLRYLARRHEKSVLKVRFVLAPFSFVFLIAGSTKYHVIWETLDSEEATYIWQVEKNRSALTTFLKELEISLAKIRSEGRQAFLQTCPPNFSRIIHDYSDAKKGFIMWKGQLEERLA